MVSSSPGLIAASHVLHRLSMPRHPPCAHNNLPYKMLALAIQFPKTTPPANPDQPATTDRRYPSRPAPTKRTAVLSELHRAPKQPHQWSTKHPAANPPSGRPTTLCSRKEVIQPHLPVRLPCYDFVPIADPTFDGSPPHGLGHRLRVLPTFMT